MHIKSLTKSQMFPFGLVCFFLVFQMIANIVKLLLVVLAKIQEKHPSLVHLMAK